MTTKTVLKKSLRLVYLCYAPYDSWSPFLRSKMNPTLNAGINWATGEDMVGNAYNYQNFMADLILPLFTREFAGGMSYDRKNAVLKQSSGLDWRSENVGRGLATLAGSMIGLGVNAYPTREKSIAYKQAASEKGGMDYATPAEERKADIRSNLKFAIRLGIDVTDELKKYEREKLFSSKEIEAIKKAKDRLPLEDLLFDRSNPPSKEKLERIWRAAQENENSLNNLQDLAAKERLILEKMIRNAKK